MARWPISDEAARDMYAGGLGNEPARGYARWWGRLFGAGLFPRRWVTLEVPGRTSGHTTSFPLGMADLDGHWYLVSMLGECHWVANVRAAEGNAILRRRRRRPVHLREVPPELRAPIRGKGANLAEMAAVLGLPVPPGFTITTTACRDFLRRGWPPGLTGEIDRHLAVLELTMARSFGDDANPLLLSVRSGAKFSMPG